MFTRHLSFTQGSSIEDVRREGIWPSASKSGQGEGSILTVFLRTSFMADYKISL